MRRWQGKKGQPSHADDWLITYADMITLLLCFFVVFIVVSVSKKNVPQTALVHQAAEVPQQVALPVTQTPAQPPVIVPDVFQGNLPFHDIAQYDQEEGTATPTAPVINAQSPLVAASVASVKTGEPPQASAEILAATIADIANDLKAMGSQNVEQKSDRITTFEMNSAAFFDSGLALLSEPGKVILNDIAVRLKSDKFRDYQITVEGHTDDTPIHTAQFPSNWELSTARASAVVHFFLDQGISPQKLRAAGYADTFPKVPNRDTGGNAIPLNQAQNRRVVIKLEKIEKNDISAANDPSP